MVSLPGREQSVPLLVARKVILELIKGCGDCGDAGGFCALKGVGSLGFQVERGMRSQTWRVSLDH